MGVFAAIDTYLWPPFLSSNLDPDKWIHLVKKARLSVVGQVSWLYVNLNETFAWNNESAANSRSRLLLDDDLWLLHHLLLLLHHPLLLLLLLLDNSLLLLLLLLNNVLLHLLLLSNLLHDGSLGLNNNCYSWLLVKYRRRHDNLWTSVTVMEFWLEVDSSSWLAVELNLNPFFLWPVLGENCKRHIRLANERSL